MPLPWPAPALLNSLQAAPRHPTPPHPVQVSPSSCLYAPLRKLTGDLSDNQDAKHGLPDQQQKRQRRAGCRVARVMQAPQLPPHPGEQRARVAGHL